MIEQEPFKLFYDTGQTVLGGGPGDPMVPVTFMVPLSFLEAPSDGLQFVLERQPDDCNYSDRHMYSGKDYFPYLKTGGFESVDDLGPWLRNLGFVKFGRMMGEKAYRELYQLVKEDKDIPMKTDRPRIKRPWLDEDNGQDRETT